MQMMRILLIALALLFSVNAQAKDISILTWKIEKLGATGRGETPGYGAKNLGLRSDLDLEYIAGFIREILKADIVAIQDIAVSRVVEGVPVSDPLNKIVEHLGPGWRSTLAASGDGAGAITLGYLWNSNNVRGLKFHEMPVPRGRIAGAPLFDQVPMVGYFEAIGIRDESANDFVLVNVQLTPGEENVDNHLIAMVELRSQLDSVLQSIDVREQDRVILGNFNDNPYRTTDKGKPVYPATLYQYMDFHGYRNYVTDEFRSTRMDSELSEVLDHVLVNSQAEKHVIGDKKAVPWMPLGGVAELPEWRRTYSDHFPVRIKLRVSYDDDADFQPPQPDAADLRQ